MGERWDGEQVGVRGVARERAVTRVTDLERDLVAGVGGGDRLDVRVPAVVPARGALVEAPRTVDRKPEAQRP
jgi:hypothetical protein